MKEEWRPCPVCGQHMFTKECHYRVCPMYKWEDDTYQERHPDSLGANEITLNQAREEWAKKNK